jgi:hypothetical protein
LDYRALDDIDWTGGRRGCDLQHRHSDRFFFIITRAAKAMHREKLAFNQKLAERKFEFEKERAEVQVRPRLA